MQEQAELTASTLPLQLLKSVGIAAASVVVEASHWGQNASASAANLSSIMLR